MPHKTGRLRCAVICAVFLALFSPHGETARVSARDAVPRTLAPDAPGERVFSTASAILDVSNASEGYVMLNYRGKNPKVKFRVTTPDGTNYTYLVTDYQKYTAYPLSGGNGKYAFTVYEVVSEKDALFVVDLAQSVTVAVDNGLSPFLYPNHYVNFDAASACVKKASALAKNCGTDLDVVSNVYRYVTDNIAYDDDKAAAVQSGYTPFPDATLASGKGICFDYASLMSAMLRSQGIPTRLEVGYVGTLYHAWISCHISDIGWVDGIIRFDGAGWTMMDPTMAAGQSRKSFQKFLEDNTYFTKYLY